MKANYNRGQKSLDNFEFLGRFPVHTYNAPSGLTPQTTLDARFQNFFPSLYRAGEGELLENFEKDALFHDRLCMDIPLGPPIVSEGRGGGLYTGYFMREPRNYRKL